MSLSINPKKDYQLVKWHFRKEIEIPETWSVEKLGKLCSLRKNEESASELYIGLEHISKDSNTLEGKGNISEFSSTKNQFHEGDILYGKLRPLLNKVWLATESGHCSTDILPIVSSKKILNHMLLYILSNHYFLSYAVGTSAGTKMPRTNWPDLKKFIVFLPPLKEQQKIASILSNINNLIENTEKLILQIKLLRQSLLQKIVTEGIGHKKFVNVNLGKKILDLKVPDDWKSSKFIDALKTRSNLISLEPEKKYKRIIVKRRHEGVVLRDEVSGKEILTENQYLVTVGDYVLTHKQVIHGAGGLIPKELDGAVISKEYSQFFGTDILAINYFNLFSMTHIFKKMIILTTQGVHIEKYVFNKNEWLNFKIPIPPMSEQKKIVSIFDNLDDQINLYELKKKRLKSLKKSLMQKLPTGEVRVKV